MYAPRNEKRNKKKKPIVIRQEFVVFLVRSITDQLTLGGVMGRFSAGEDAVCDELSTRFDRYASKAMRSVAKIAIPSFQDPGIPINGDRTSAVTTAKTIIVFLYFMLSV